MDKRYIATITDTSDTGQSKILVVDQRQSKIVHDSVTAKELVEGMKKLFLTQYGSEIMFIEKDETSSPVPNHWTRTI